MRADRPASTAAEPGFAVKASQKDGVMSTAIRSSWIVLPSRSSGSARSSLAVDCGRSEASLRRIADARGATVDGIQRVLADHRGVAAREYLLRWRLDVAQRQPE